MKMVQTSGSSPDAIKVARRSGVRSLDLVNTWRDKTTTTPLPLCQKMEFAAVGRRWRVLWPPRELPPHQLAALNGAVHDIERLPRKLAPPGGSNLNDKPPGRHRRR